MQAVYGHHFVRVSFFISVLIFLCSINSQLYACNCPPIKPIDAEWCKKYDVIFFGKVDSIEKCSINGKSKVYFSLSKLYKGAVQPKAFLEFDCSSSCMMSFTINEEWLIYSTYQKFDLLGLNICSHSRKKFATAEQDYYLASSQRKIEDEMQVLNELLGEKTFATENNLNQMQSALKPVNEQPSGISKLILLLVSLSAMLLVAMIVKLKKRQ
jgi:hypothetical protein